MILKMRNGICRLIRAYLLSAFFLTAIFIVAGPALSFAQAPNPAPPTETVRLVFIHHSTGEKWLADAHGRLGIALRDNNYFVSDTNNGWGPNSLFGDPIGNHTDVGDWYWWFLGPKRDTFCSALYAESGRHYSTSPYSRLANNPGGENTIIMFKSCFPNSNIDGNPSDPPLPKGQQNPLWGSGAGSGFLTVTNVKGLYRDLLDYFATKPGKLFVIIISPPLVQNATTAARAANARAVANWLVNDWLSGYAYNNVVAFDFYSLLTSNGGSVNANDAGWEAGNHHRYWNSQIQHVQSVASNYSAYGSTNSDSHPTTAGDLKATAEFVPLLNIYYNRWKGTAPPAPTLTVMTPSSGINWERGSTQSITWTKDGDQNANVKIKLYKGGAFAKDITTKTVNDESFSWKIPSTATPATNYTVKIMTVDNMLSDISDQFTIYKTTPFLTVTSPAAAVHWAGNTTQTIAWTKSGVQNDYVRVQLLRNGITVRDISTKTPNDGSFEWNIPATLAASSNYLIRVKTVDGLVKDDSGLFSIDQESSPRAALKSTRLQAKHS
jgi:hypothetical protein